MTHKLTDYLSKHTLSSLDLKNLIKINLILKPFYRPSNIYSLLKILELNYKDVDIQYNNNNNKLFNVEGIIPKKYIAINNIIGYRLSKLIALKTNFTRLNPRFMKTINIYWLELIGSYRGWRHIHGLPVRGQRTWTNAWSVYKSNLDLREFLVTLTKKYL